MTAKATSWGVRVSGRTARAVTRAARANAGRIGKLPDPYQRRRPVYKKDARVLRQLDAERRDAA